MLLALHSKPVIAHVLPNKRSFQVGLTDGLRLWGSNFRWSSESSIIPSEGESLTPSIFKMSV
jgi:hypothetical protein